MLRKLNIFLVIQYLLVINLTRSAGVLSVQLDEREQYNRQEAKLNLIRENLQLFREYVKRHLNQQLMKPLQVKNALLEFEFLKMLVKTSLSENITFVDLKLANSMMREIIGKSFLVKKNY